MNKVKSPFVVIRNSKYRVEEYTGTSLDYYKVIRLLDEKHIATFYSEKALDLFLTN